MRPVPSVTRRSATGRERREAVEARVFEAVEKLLEAGESYTTLGVGRIADEAEIARSTFYVHFSDKTDLLLRLADDATDEVFGPLQQWVRHGNGDREGLEQTMIELVEGFRRHRRMLIAFNEVGAYDKEVASHWRARVDRFARRLAERLNREQADADIDWDVAASWMAWGVERTVAQHVATTKDQAGDRRVAVGIARAIWHQTHP
jgi:TetR/AcrR family transcriptional regulator, ethionamide resistance regulator